MTLTYSDNSRYKFAAMKLIHNTIFTMTRILAGTLKALVTTAAVLMLAVSCDKNIEGTGTDKGTGSVLLKVNLSGWIEGKTAKEGNVMRNLSLWIVNEDTGKILKYRKLTHDTQDESTFFSDDGKTAEVRFIDIERGDCLLYAVANYENIDTDKYAEGNTIDDAFRNILLDEVGDSEEPNFSDVTGMPCSIVQRFSIKAGENKVNAHLLRCVGRISIYAKNHIDESAVFFKSVGLSKNNPSQSYLFHHDGQIPASSQNVAFKDMDELVKVDAKTVEPVLIYETYMYETDPTVEAGTITFELFGAMYRAEVTEDQVQFGFRKDYTFDENGYSNLNTDNTIVIRSGYSTNYYLGDNSGLTARFFSGDTELRYHDGIENYFWKASGSPTSGFKLTNCATNRQISISNTTASMVANGSGTSLSVTAATNGLRLRNSNYYWLTIDADKGIYGYRSWSTPSSTNSLWQVRKVNEVAGAGIPYFSNAEYEIPRADRPLTYIDDYGVTRDLVSISRNDHLEMVINIFFNRELGEFDFTVEPWSKRDSETTFD